MVAPASAHSSILLSVDVQHAVLEPGQSINITLSIENNATAIESFNVSIDEGNLASVWTILPVDETVDNVFPTWTKNTTLVVRLAEGATVADSGSFTVNVTEPDSGSTSMITVLVSVAPAYHPSLSVDGSPLVNIGAGESTDIAFTAHNLGTVTDTFLLDVEVQPDLAAWWANHTNTSTGNSSGNSSGGDSSDNSTGNGTGSNGTNTTSLSVLMMGNSYTGSNNLATLVDGIMDADGYNATLGSLNGGGMKLPDHWSNVNSSGNQWNTTLRGSSWDYVVLQDQSQVPSFYSSNSMWQLPMATSRTTVRATGPTTGAARGTNAPSSTPRPRWWSVICSSRPAPSADGDHSFRERTVKVGTFVPAIAITEEDGPGRRSHRRTASSASTGTVETLMDTDPPSKPRRKGVKSEATTPRTGASITSASRAYPKQATAPADRPQRRMWSIFASLRSQSTHACAERRRRLSCGRVDAVARTALSRDS